jgi:hypothetical protein
VGSGDIASRVLYLGNKWRRVVKSTFRPHYIRGNKLYIHWQGGFVGPRASLSAVGAMINLTPLPEINSDSEYYTETILLKN